MSSSGWRARASLPLSALWAMVATTVIAGIAASAPIETTFPFDGLREELRHAEAIVHVRVLSTEPDSSLGLDPASRTWRRTTLRGQVTRVFRDSTLSTGDTVAISADYSRLNREFRELDQKTQQFVWGITPIESMQSVILLRHERVGWEATRCLYPDDGFVEQYLRAAALAPRECATAMMAMLLDRFLAREGGRWGPIRVLQDDLDRLFARDSSLVEVWGNAARARTDDLVRGAGHLEVTLFLQLARHLPRSAQRDCVRELVRAYDLAARELDETKDVDKNPPEMTYDLIRNMSAGLDVGVLPGAMLALLPPEVAPRGRASKSGRRTPPSDEAIVASARRYAGVDAPRRAR